jgi:hypothetical protein
MLKKHSLFMTVALTLCAGLIFLSPDLAHAAAGSFNIHDMNWHDLVQASPVLVTLRGRLDRLKKKAEKKIGSIGDDTTEDQARAIETEHETILREIETVQGEIVTEEARIAAEGAPGADPEDVDAARRAAPPTGQITTAQAVDIMDIGERAGMALADIREAVRQGVTVDAFRQRAFDHLAGQSAGQRTAPGRVVRDEAETRRAAMIEAMAYRMGAEVPQAGPSEVARGFMDFVDVPEFAAAAMGYRGRLATVREREDLLTRAFHTTSDFPNIFGSAINTVLERRYALAPQTYRAISRRRDFMDFRPHYAVGIGEFPMLEKLTEAGEIKFGTFGESKEMIAVIPYAKGIRVTRQMLVNDRLGAIAEIMGGYGRTVSRFEEITFYAMMLSANTRLSDNQVVFHADHNNLAGAGAAIGVASLGAGRAAMRKQKNIDGAQLNIAPSTLLVSPDKETEAQQYLAVIVANDSAKVNPMASSLDLVVAGQLSGNAWYLFASPEDVPTYQWGYLDGYTAPRVRLDEPFGTQGIGMTVEHDFGVGAVDFRGGYKNPGA